MIKHLKISGYKCLREVEFDTSSLNLFVGPNASGKSSALQFLLLLRQSADSSGFIFSLDLSGALYEGGLATDALHPEAERVIESVIRSTDGSEFHLNFCHDRDGLLGVNARSLMLVTPQHTNIYTARNVPLEITSDNFVYLNAERVPPKVSYALSSDKKNLAGVLGKHGEFTTSFLAREAGEEFVGDSIIELLIHTIREVDDIDLSTALISSEGRLDLIVNEVLGWIIPGAKFDVSEHADSDSASLSFVRDPLVTQTKIRPTHIGFGLTYLLPIVTGALLIQESGILIVENPEAHLHPFSQSRIGVFLAAIASTGRQIFVETHSDHVVNGVRLAIKKQCISHEKLRTFFFDRPTNGTTAHVTTITCDVNAQMSRWPKGFFDQIENDLFRL